jgi:hypothetical protein
MSPDELIHHIDSAHARSRQVIAAIPAAICCAT